MHSVICSGLGSLECFVIIKCTKFGQLFLRKIIKIVATRCQILRLKCTKFDFGLGLRPRPRWGSLQRSPITLSWISGGLLLRGGSEREKKDGVRKKEREGMGRRREGKAFPLLWFYSLSTANNSTNSKSCMIHPMVPFPVTLSNP